MTNVESMDYTHSHPFTIPSLSSTVQLLPVPYTFLKTVTIPTYYGISIAIPRYIVMQLFTVPFYYDMLHHCHIALHDHVVDIVFVAKATVHNSFILVTLDSLHIPVHRRRHSHSHICSKYRVVILEL